MRKKKRKQLLAETVLNTEMAATSCGVTPRTVRNWAQHGVGGVVLESFRVGGSIRTTLQAIHRFQKRLASSALYST